MAIRKNIFTFLTVLFGTILFLFSNIYSANTSTYILKVKDTDSYRNSAEKNKLPTIQSKSIFEDLISVYEKRGKDKILSSEQTSALLDLSNYYLIQNPSNQEIETLKNSKSIVSFSPNYIFRIDSVKGADFDVPNDEGYESQWALKAIKATKAWKYATGAGIIVGVVDTGIDFEHIDLKHSLWINSLEDINQSGEFEDWSSDEIIDGKTGDLNGIDEDGNGFADDVIGYDFVDQQVANIGDYSSSDPIPADENSHGTIVSGIIAAEANNRIGITGLAFDAKIISIRAFDASGNGESDDIARSIVYAVLNGAKVLNFSFGEPDYSPIIYDAIKFAYANGCVMAASSGNSNSDQSHFPSDHEEVITTGSATEKGTRAFRSNYGSFLRLLAPGQDILSTDVGGGYRKADGTSMAAPYVAASAALLLEKNPSLSPADVCGILQASAQDLLEPGWDIYSGSGLINLERAFEISGQTNLSVKFPHQGDFFDREKTETINFVANVVTPLFQSWQVFIGQGETPNAWTAVNEEIFEQSLGDTLTKINIVNLTDTTYTARILVKLRNNNTIERRVKFYVVSSETPLRFKSLKNTPVYFGDSKSLLISAETNQPSSFSVMIRKFGSVDDFKKFSEVEEHSLKHFLIAKEGIPRDVEMEAVAIAIRNDGVTASDTFRFTLTATAMPTSDFIEKSYSLPLAYVLNEVTDLYKDGKPAIVINDISRLYYDNIMTYKFEDGKFVKANDAREQWIPVGIGDSNGDGLPEIFGTGSYKSILYQGAYVGDNPFSGALLKGLVQADFWGETMFDLNGDGREELIAFNDHEFFALTNNNGNFEVLAEAGLDTNEYMLGTAEDAVLGDFDGDGKNELVHSDKYGNIYFFEFDNNKFTREFTFDSLQADGPNYLCKADLEGDGIYEILLLTSTTAQLYSNSENAEMIWSAKIFKSTAFNKYELFWEEAFYGVREGVVGELGFSYKNGVSAGDIDNLPGDEIVISTFPNLYIFKFDNAGGMKPLWWYPSAYANSAIIYDFDANGKNEIGFGTFSNTKFFEYSGGDNRPTAPAGLEGWALGSESAFLQWNEVPSADSYRILQVIRENGTVSVVSAGETSETNITLTGLTANKWYEYALISIDNSKEIINSNPTYSIDIFTHHQVEPTNLIVLDPSTLQADFSGELPDYTLEPADFMVNDENMQKEILPETVILTKPTSALLSFKNPLTAGKYLLSISSFRDKYKSPTSEKQFEFEIKEQLPSETELYLSRLEVVDGNTLSLLYSEEVSQNEAENTSYYTLSQGGEIASVELDLSNKSLVTIHLSKGSGILGALGKNYFLTVSDLFAVSGNKMTKGAGNTLGFVFSPDDNKSAFVYPNPIKISGNPLIYFANVSNKAEITILDMNGEVKRILQESDSNGGVEWDGRDNKGYLLNSGVYLFKVKDLIDNNKDSGLKKFVITR